MVSPGPGPANLAVLHILQYTHAMAPPILHTLQDGPGHGPANMANFARWPARSLAQAILQNVARPVRTWPRHPCTLATWPGLYRSNLANFARLPTPALAQPVLQTLQDDPGRGPANLANSRRPATALVHPILQQLQDDPALTQPICKLCKTAPALAPPILQTLQGGPALAQLANVAT